MHVCMYVCMQVHLSLVVCVCLCVCVCVCEHMSISVCDPFHINSDCSMCLHEGRMEKKTFPVMDSISLNVFNSNLQHVYIRA